MPSKIQTFSCNQTYRSSSNTRNRAQCPIHSGLRQGVSASPRAFPLFCPPAHLLSKPSLLTHLFYHWFLYPHFSLQPHHLLQTPMPRLGTIGYFSSQTMLIMPMPEIHESQAQIVLLPILSLQNKIIWKLAAVKCPFGFRPLLFVTVPWDMHCDYPLVLPSGGQETSWWGKKLSYSAELVNHRHTKCAP